MHIKFLDFDFLIKNSRYFPKHNVASAACLIRMQEIVK